MALEIAAAAALVIWAYLLLGRGGFWRMRDPQWEGSLPSSAPRVAVVIPARNEAGGIGRAVASLEAQKYAGEFQIIVVDDHSDDGTAAAARAAGGGRLTVIAAPPLEPGWTGKMWAVAQGVREAERFSPYFLLLTDADIVHPPDNLARLVAQAVSGGDDLVSQMVMLRCRSLAERALMPPFVFFFFLLYPPSWISNPRRRTAGAAGGCMLIRRETLKAIGEMERIRSELIDDCALARAVKSSGGRVRLGLASHTKSIREYKTFREIGRMISRTAFTELRYSGWRLAGITAGMALSFLVPPAAAFAGLPAGVAAWGLMCVIYLPALRYYRRSPWWAPLLPAVALFYLGATFHSAFAYWRGSGGMWKGRAQAGTKRTSSGVTLN